MPGRLPPLVASLCACAIAAPLVPFARLAAQSVEARAVPTLRAPCDGSVISVIDIRTHPPSYKGTAAEAVQTVEQVVGMHQNATRAGVVSAYLRFREGDACTERNRSESERLLRAQPFISSAAVRTVPDGLGRVRIQVDVVDEFALVGSVRLARGSMAAASFGSQNVAGLGLGVVLSATRGFAYRSGFGARVIQYGIFGKPDYLALAAERFPLGEAFSFEFAEPFLTDLQRHASHIGASESSDYFGVVRPEGADVALTVRRTAYDAGWVTRVGSPGRGRTVGLLGVALLGEDVRVGDRAKIVSDTGLINAPDSALDARYPAIAATRVALIGGVRAVHFITVSGFDALRGQQDLAQGVQFGLLAGPSVWASRKRSDLFVAGEFYAGAGGSGAFVAVHLLAEARGNYQTHSWDGLVGSARFQWHTTPSDRVTRLLTIDASAVQHLAFPLQLTFRDADGGLPGYQDATAAGGQRATVQVEERHLLPYFSRRVDLAVAAFASAGKLWAGDVPYGLTTDVRASLGISLLGAYPAGGKRTVRVDFAVPLQPERGRAKYQVKFTLMDRTRLFGLEPRDVARARTGAVPTNLVRW